jgi:hypothetical protein
MINVTEEGYTDSDYPFDIFKLFVFQKRVVHANCISTFVFYITGSILYTTAGGLLVTECIIRPVVRVSALTWIFNDIFIIEIYSS